MRRGEDDYLFVLVPAGRRFDWPKLRGAPRRDRGCRCPTPTRRRPSPGYVRYTITPFGSTRAWPVIVDAAVMAEPVVSVGGGVRGVNLHFAPADLVSALSAEAVDVTIPEE